METVKKFESILEEWLKPLPHLPAEWRKWLANNAWWMTLISAILSGLSALAYVGTLLDALSLRGFTGFYGYYVPQIYSGLWFFATIVSLAFLVITTVFSATAVNPLKVMSRKGWDLLFLVYIVSLISAIVNQLLVFNYANMIYSLISLVISAAVGGYILFEVKGYFKVEAKRVVKKSKK